MSREIAERQQSVDQSNQCKTDSDAFGSGLEEELRQAIRDELQADFDRLEPAEGVKNYLKNRTDITEQTSREYRRKLNFFVQFAENEEISQLADLSPRDVNEYRAWRREESTDEVESLAPKTMRDEMFLLRDFLEHLESINAVEEGLSEAVTIPELSEGDGVRDVELTQERVERILEYLEKFEYATLEHVTFALLARTGRRIGGIYGLDLEDYHSNEEGAYLEFRHRPGETRLKNGESGEEEVGVKADLKRVIDDYIRNNRIETTDEFGRKPLLTSQNGRPAKSTLRRYVYKWTRPCAIGRECPHDKEPEDCPAASSSNKASKCDSTRSPHALRHGYLTHLRRKEIPTFVITERCDVSEEVLEKHYDERTPEERRQHRERMLDEVDENGGGYL